VFDRLSPTQQRQLRSICETVLAGLDHQPPRSRRTPAPTAPPSDANRP
jgi:hypothetical protein